MKPYILVIPGMILALMVLTACNQWALLRLRAERGDPQAMFEYGVYLIKYRPRNFYDDGKEGEQWIEKAANKGSKQAMRKMGGIYAMSSRPEDEVKAVQWYLRAAEHGETSSMTELANAYHYGQLGLPKNESKALYWEERFKKTCDEDALAPYIKVATTGNAESMMQLARMYDKGLSEEHSKEAVEWYTKAAQAGNKDAMMRLVNAYQHGELGLPKDQGKSDIWFRKWQEAMGAK